MEQESIFHSTLLDSGVQVVAQPMAGVESAAFGILIGTGARDEEPQQAGVSHFTEQMMFRGTENMDARELSERFDALGIDYDSSSGLEMTLFSAVLIGNRLPTAIDLLADVVRFPSFPDDALENVRSSLVLELRQREDRPAQKAMDAVRRLFFRGSPLSHDVLGTETTLSAIGRPQLQSYWQRRFTANNMVISIAGNFNWDQLVEQLTRVTSTWPTGDGRMEVEQPAPQRGIEITQREASQENIAMAFPGVPYRHPDYYAAALVSQAFGGSSNSRLFKEVREKRGLAYAVQCRFDGMESAGLFRVYVGTSADRAHESVEVVLNELKTLEADGITDEELRIAKVRLKSALVMRSESTSARMAANLRSWWFEGKLHGLDEIKDRIDSVTREQTQALLRDLRISERVAAVALGPRSEEELFGSVLTAS